MSTHTNWSEPLSAAYRNQSMLNEPSESSCKDGVIL